MLEELLDALEDDGNETDCPKEELVEDVVLAVGQTPSDDVIRRKTMKQCGKIAKLEVLILVDSRSVGTFISEQLASKLQLQAIDCGPVHFVAANGGPMVCSQSGRITVDCSRAYICIFSWHLTIEKF